MAKKGKGKVPKNLPPSKDKEFWGDGEIISGEKEVLKTESKHSWIQRGNKAYCTSCSLKHGLFLAPNQEVREGKIVPKKPVRAGPAS
jgi:hypothetical protein